MTEPATGLEPSGVPWLPPFRLDGRVLLDGVLEVTHPADGLRPFARLVLDQPTGRFRPEGGDPVVSDVAGLREVLRGLPADDLSRGARARRWQLRTALAALEATAVLARLGDLSRWRSEAVARRHWLLGAIDAGSPPEAAALLEACRAVPHGLRHLGNALPTAEAVALLKPLGRICEPGAGMGLFARALERAGLAVAASDPATGGGTGLAFPVRKGWDAVATLDAFASMGEVPPLLLLWPQFDEGDWFLEAFARVARGGHVALASPEFEFCLAGGLDATMAEERASAGPGWHAAPRLIAMIERDFEPLGQAPLVASGWPLAPTPLRLWRRR